MRNVVTLLALIIYVIPSLAFIVQSELRKDRERAVHDLSHFDTLTGLRNRASAATEIETLFNAPDTQAMTFYFVDIDDFSDTNKTFGMSCGDALLKEMAVRLVDLAPAGSVIGRLGSDEFIVAVPNLLTDEERVLARNIVRAARAPILGLRHTIEMRVSVGMCPSAKATDVETALRAGALALSRAKTARRHQYVVFTDDLDFALREHRRTEDALLRTIKKGTVTVYYQPLVAADGKTVIGFEALARLVDADGSMISPVDFIPVAEETGLIDDFGRLILRQALQECQTWSEDVFVSVNLSPLQFQRGNICHVVATELERSGVSPDRLELEITESVLLDESESVADQLVGLRALGIRLAMDDFGTGYSSLGYLWTYDFDKLKIDRIFLENYEFDQARHRDIIETIVVLAHKMSMVVTVEGVENPRQVEMLKTLNVDQFQGYHFSKPLAADAATAFLNGARSDEDAA